MKPFLIIFIFLSIACNNATDKKGIDLNDVTHIEISKHNERHARVLSEPQVKSFIDKWNESKGEGSCIFIARYIIAVYLKDSTRRSFRINGQAIKEQTDYCYLIGDTAYFDKLWNDCVPIEKKGSSIMKDTSLMDYLAIDPKQKYLLDSAINTILKLPEVGIANKRIDSLTQGKHGIAYIIDNPSADEPYYGIDIGFNGEYRFETYFSFCVYIHKNSFKIRVNDPFSKSGDGTSTIEQWRENMSKSKNR